MSSNSGQTGPISFQFFARAAETALARDGGATPYAKAKAFPSWGCTSEVVLSLDVSHTTGPGQKIALTDTRIPHDPRAAR